MSLLPDLILFDFDGTIVNLNPAPEDLESLRDLLLMTASREDIRPKNRSVFGLYEQFQSVGKAPIADAFITSYEQSWSRVYAQPLLSEESFRHLAEISAYGIKLGIVTNNSALAVETCLAQGICPSEFEIVVGRESGARLKPSSEMLTLAITQASCTDSDGARFLFIGDSDNDESAARSFNADDRNSDIEFIRVVHKLRDTDRIISDIRESLDI